MSKCLSNEFSKLCHVNVDSDNHIMSEILNHEPVIVDSPEKNQNDSTTPYEAMDRTGGMEDT